MTHTDSFEKDSLPLNCAIGYTGEGTSRITNHETLPEKGSSAGGGYSTVQDLLKYTVALEHGTITPSGNKDRRGFGIAGGAPGLNAALEWNPGSGYTIVVMANLDPPAAERVARQIRAWLPVKD
jgi:D-alanyl-D-alanine carboxypeptidase